MSTENQGISGPASLRIDGMKVSNLPFGARQQVAEMMPDFLQEQRKIKVDSIIARYPRAKKPWCEGAIRECELNVVKFKAERAHTMKEMDRYHGLMRRNDGREWDEVEAEVTQLVIDRGKPQPGTDEFETLRADIRALNETRKPYEGEALWGQIKLFQENLERYDDAIAKERESIIEMKDILRLIGERDRLISQAMSEPLSVE